MDRKLGVRWHEVRNDSEAFGGGSQDQVARYWKGGSRTRGSVKFIYFLLSVCVSGVNVGSLVSDVMSLTCFGDMQAKGGRRQGCWQGPQLDPHSRKPTAHCWPFKLRGHMQSPQERVLMEKRSDPETKPGTLQPTEGDGAEAAKGKEP